MSLVAGSYERFIWGFRLKHLKSETQTLTLTPLFSYPAHLSPITSLAVSGPVAASSASDDSLKIYDLSTSSELTSLLPPTSASITSLSFFSSHSPSPLPSNLLASSDDGSVSIFDADPFVLLKSVPVHKRAVNDLAVHPSGRLAVTVSKDSCLGMVNLVRGRRSFCCRIDSEAGIVGYCGGGERFFMGSGGRVSVHCAEDARLVAEFVAPKRVLCAAPGENGLIFTGGEDRGITAWDSKTGKAAYSIEGAHSSRVKGIVVLSTEVDAEYPYMVASASSDGSIRVWDVRSAAKEKPAPLAEVNTKSRLTCLAGSTLKSFKKQKSVSDGKEHEAVMEEDS